MKETTWKVEIDSSQAGEHKAETWTGAETDQDPTVIPETYGPYANDVIANPDAYDDSIATFDEDYLNPGAFIKP